MLWVLNRMGLADSIFGVTELQKWAMMMTMITVPFHTYLFHNEHSQQTLDIKYRLTLCWILFYYNRIQNILLFFSMKCLLPKLLPMLFFLIYFIFFWVNKPIIFVLMWEVYRVYKWRIDVTVKQFFNNYLIQISESIGWQKSVTHKRPPIIESDSHFIDSILLKTILSPF